jgi:hypothetical protein
MLSKAKPIASGEGKRNTEDALTVERLGLDARNFG